jgi:hypothetical protein
MSLRIAAFVLAMAVGTALHGSRQRSRRGFPHGTEARGASLQGGAIFFLRGEKAAMVTRDRQKRE